MPNARRVDQYRTEAAAADQQLGFLGTLENFAAFTVDNTAALVGASTHLASDDLAAQQIVELQRNGHTVDDVTADAIRLDAKGAEDATLGDRAKKNAWVKWALLGAGALAALGAAAYVAGSAKAVLA